MKIDKQLSCRDCGQQFTWTKGEQDFFQQKGFNAPVRCQRCRQARKLNR